MSAPEWVSKGYFGSGERKIRLELAGYGNCFDAVPQTDRSVFPQLDLISDKALLFHKSTDSEAWVKIRLFCHQEMSMGLLKLRYDCPRHYRLFTTCHTHGWKYLAPFRWDDSENTLEFCCLADETPADLRVCQQDGSLEVEIRYQGRITSNSRSALDCVVRRSLDLDADVSELLDVASSVGKPYASLVKRGGGRLLRSPTLWEDAAKTLFTTNCSWALTEKMCESFCGTRFAKPCPSGAFPFPRPAVIRRLSPDKLRASAPVGYRADYVLDLARRFDKDATLDDLETRKNDYAAAYKNVNQIKGFGRYATTHLLVMAGYYDEIPFDSEIASYLQTAHGTSSPEEFAEKKYAAWGRYIWWGFKFDRMLGRRNWLGDQLYRASGFRIRGDHSGERDQKEYFDGLRQITFWVWTPGRMYRIWFLMP